MAIVRIVAGGQTGVDQAALDAAISPMAAGAPRGASRKPAVSPTATRGSQLSTHPNRITNLLLAVIWKANGTLFCPLYIPHPDNIE